MRNGWCRALGIGLLAYSAMLATPAAADSTRYVLEGSRCKLVAHLYKDGLGARFAHDHVVRAAKVMGAITFDPEHPEETRILVEADARALVVDEPELRRAYRLKGKLSDDDRREVAANMHGEEQLHTSKYPRIRFEAESVSRFDKQRYAVKGALTLRGVKRQVSFPAKVRVVGEKLEASGQLRLKQSDFGYRPFRAAMGLVKVKDHLLLDLYLSTHGAGRNTHGEDSGGGSREGGVEHQSNQRIAGLRPTAPSP